MLVCSHYFSCRFGSCSCFVHRWLVIVRSACPPATCKPQRMQQRRNQVSQLQIVSAIACPPGAWPQECFHFAGAGLHPMAGLLNTSTGFNLHKPENCSTKGLVAFSTNPSNPSIHLWSVRTFLLSILWDFLARSYINTAHSAFNKQMKSHRVTRFSLKIVSIIGGFEGNGDQEYSNQWLTNDWAKWQWRHGAIWHGFAVFAWFCTTYTTIVLMKLFWRLRAERCIDQVSISPLDQGTKASLRKWGQLITVPGPFLKSECRVQRSSCMCVSPICDCITSRYAA